MIIRQACIDDLPQVANVHAICFPENFSTVLSGKNKHLLERLYYEYLQKTPKLFLVAIEKETVIGFCMGYYFEDNHYQSSFLKHNALKVAGRLFLLLLTGNKVAWKKITRKRRVLKNESLIDRKSSLKDTDKGDLLSICVLSSYRGRGVARELVSEYLNCLRNSGRKECWLSVENNNVGAMSFYEKCGFAKYSKNEIATVYIKSL